MKTQRLNTVIWVSLVLSITLQGCGGGGSEPVAGGSTGAVALKIYQFSNVRGYADANGGLYTHIHPEQLEAYGGSPLSGYTWTVTTGTSLPFPGMIIDPLTGLVRGSLPSGTAPGNYPFQVTVSDGSRTYSSSGAYVQVVACDSRTAGAPDPANCAYNGPISCASGSSSDINLGGTAPFKAGRPVGYSLTVSGGVPPYKNWTVVTGSLPSGLTIDQARGVLHGTPVSSAAGNTYTFTVRVADNTNATCPGASSSPATYRITL